MIFQVVPLCVHPFTWRGVGEFLDWALMENAAVDPLVTGFDAHESDFFGSGFFFSLFFFLFGSILSPCLPEFVNCCKIHIT